jgi:hypothetical protein
MPVYVLESCRYVGQLKLTGFCITKVLEDLKITFDVATMSEKIFSTQASMSTSLPT